jgi:hypothetical protein
LNRAVEHSYSRIKHTKLTPSPQSKTWCRQITQRMLGLCDDIQYRKTWRHLPLLYTYFSLHLFSSLAHGGAFVCGWGWGVSGTEFKLETRVKGLWLIAQGRTESMQILAPCLNTLAVGGFSLGVVRTKAGADTATAAVSDSSRPL